jgi:hypothetical protein
MKRSTKNWKSYCKTAFNNLRANLDDWGDPEYVRPITRSFYICVFDLAQMNHTGLISEQALNNPSQRTYDHYLSPQFVGRMIMDNPDPYLEDYDLFENLFWFSCSTITVTKSENKQLSLLTNNKGNDYKVFVPTDKKYKHLGINLYETVKKGSRWNMKNVTPFEYQTLPVPSDLLSYEKQFLIG